MDSIRSTAAHFFLFIAEILFLYFLPVQEYLYEHFVFLLVLAVLLAAINTRESELMTNPNPFSLNINNNNGQAAQTINNNFGQAAQTINNNYGQAAQTINNNFETDTPKKQLRALFAFDPRIGRHAGQQTARLEPFHIERLNALISEDPEIARLVSILGVGLPMRYCTINNGTLGVTYSCELQFEVHLNFRETLFGR
jgi:hypothetical protein